MRSISFLTKEIYRENVHFVLHVLKNKAISITEPRKREIMIGTIRRNSKVFFPFENSIEKRDWKNGRTVIYTSRAQRAKKETAQSHSTEYSKHSKRSP